VDGNDGVRQTRESPGEIDNLAVALQALFLERLNPLDYLAIDHSMHEVSEVTSVQIVNGQERRSHRCPQLSVRRFG
jgi:hypothetical protein